MDDDLRTTKGGGDGDSPHETDPEAPDGGGRLDLAALDPTLDPERLSHVVRRIGARAASELARRADQDTDAITAPFDAIAIVQVMRGWQRVLWPAAAAIVLASLATLRVVEYPTAEAETAEGGTAESQLAQAIGVPAYIAEWVVEGELPAPGQLVFSEEEQ
jgi:hypothetical protein